MNTVEIDVDLEPQDEVSGLMLDCDERSMIIYHLLRMIRDFYINSRDGGKGTGAYRKQCRSIRKAAINAILDPSEEALSFRWSCKVLGFEPDEFKARILFDVKSISDLMRDGVKINAERERSGFFRKALTSAEIWLYDHAPAKYHLSEKKGSNRFVVKMDGKAAEEWLDSLENSPMEFDIEQFPLNTGNIILILKTK